MSRERRIRDGLRQIIERGSLFDVVYVTKDGKPQKAMLVEDIEQLLALHGGHRRRK